MRPAVAYIRHSSANHDRELAEMRAAIAKYAAENDYRVVEEFVDDKAKYRSKGDREQFDLMCRKLLRDESTQPDAIIVYKHSHLSRNASLSAWLEREFDAAGIKLICITTVALEKEHEPECHEGLLRSFERFVEAFAYKTGGK